LLVSAVSVEIYINGHIAGTFCFFYNDFHYYIIGAPFASSYHHFKENPLSLCQIYLLVLS